MAYYMFMGNMQIPINPKELSTTINNKNETLDLMNVGEVNVLKPAGLTDISFEMMLPNSNYPFNGSLLMKSKKASYYLDKLKKMKTSYKPFQFIVVRMKPNGEMLHMTNMKVTLEDYVIRESHDQGFDCIVGVKLKSWKDYGTKKLVLEKDENGNTKGTVKTNRPTSKVPNTSAKVGSGASLQAVVKKELGNTNNLFAIARLNKITVPAVLAAGQVIQLKEGV